MKSRWLSTFTLIGLLLLALGVAGLVLQHGGTGLVFDPGQPPPADGHDRTSLYYLVIGALMVLNGLVTPAAAPGEVARKTGTAGSAAPPVSSGRPSPTREVIVTSADKTGDQI